jgi:lipopolysaccharide transport system permease protein
MPSWPNLTMIRSSSRDESGRRNARYENARLHFPWHYKADLLRELVLRDVRLRYKRSLLGVLWSLLNPLLQLLVFSLIFGVVLPLDIPNYPLFLFVGLLPWIWFQNSLLEGTGAIVDNRDLIRRPGFDSTVLPFVAVTTNLIHFLIALPVLLVFLRWSGVPFNPWVLALPLVIAVQFVVTLSLAYVVASVYVHFRDMRYLLGIGLMLGFYLSPVFYDSAAIPSTYQSLYHLNPMATLIESYRSLLLYDRGFPEVGALLLLGFAGTLALWLSLLLFRRMSVTFAEEL